MKRGIENLRPYDYLTDKDKDLIQYYIDNFGPTDSNNMDWSNWAGLETVLSAWDTAKSESLFKLLNNELIVTRFFTYKYTIESLANEIELAQSNYAYINFKKWWLWRLPSRFDSPYNFTVVTANNNATVHPSAFVDSILRTSILAKNAYDGPEYKVTFEDNSVFKVSQGMKPMKIFHKFIDKYGSETEKDMFENFRIWHSQLLNQKAVDGELCLSIHPLDYMTMSDNANNWSSCMHWTDRNGEPDSGDYRAGTIDCLNSPYIVIAYLHNSKHPFNIRNEWEWNSKRWRELFIINESSITEIKGYPYQDENLTNTCLMWLKELAEKNLGWTYDDEEYNGKREIYIDDKEILLDYQKSPFMYKDIGTLDKHSCRINKKLVLANSKPYSAYYFTKTDINNCRIFEIPYGGVATCMCCGKERESYNNNDNLVMCDQCEAPTYCACCSEPIYSTDDLYWIDDVDGPICSSCFEDVTVMDDLTETMHLECNTIQLYLLLGYDIEKNPVWYQYQSINVYDPDNNWEYQRLFNDSPRHIDGRSCVTLDMINSGYFQSVVNLFNANNEELYPDEVYYNEDMIPVNTEE